MEREDKIKQYGRNMVIGGDSVDEALEVLQMTYDLTDEEHDKYREYLEEIDD